MRGLVTHDKGKTLSVILDELSRVGYHTTYKVMTSLEHGVPQMRQRVYFVGVRKDLTDTIEDFVWPETEETPALEEYLIDRVPATEERLEILGYYLKNPTNNGKYTVDDLRAMNGKVLDTRMNDLRIYEGKVPTLRAQRDGILYVYDGVIYQLTGYYSSGSKGCFFTLKLFFLTMKLFSYNETNLIHNEIILLRKVSL